MMTSYMERITEEITIENASFRKSQGPGGKQKSSWSYKQLEIPKSPNHAMEFLCRSWSPSASDFLQIFSSNVRNYHYSLLQPTDTNEQDDDNSISAEGTPTATVIQDNYKMDFKHPKPWLRSKSLTSLLRSRKEKKKEETRLHTAQLHAALSLTQLAAAIAGIGNSIGKQGVCSQDMGNVLSSSAALITTVCAEAAESLGAQRAQVRGAVNTGMAIQTPIDMIAVTATAATCLRGAALLKSRAMVDSLTKIQEMLKVGARICIIMPSDKVTNITEERMECQGNFFLCLKTENGIIKLLFENEVQSQFWTSTILNLLEMRNPSWLASQTPNHSPTPCNMLMKLRD
ncbi:hypothetical protein BUALT_Bualt01G0088800 [Buddleja alternifolia]|uniref:VAN3-binding protein-like auxin canalisation domain-containing protein n=1 Tax=Buddleja alternifolia TaxID=168488 RepID=A0AAV6YG37_9LAMI|nr:hypothetical protein BUALT_Bualt01G0088800 [Buddleja alternifolia]